MSNNNEVMYKNMLIQSLAYHWDLAGKTESSKLADMYLDYFNDFLSVDRFCEHYEIQSIALGKAIINHGRVLHEQRVKMNTEYKI